MKKIFTVTFLLPSFILLINLTSFGQAAPINFAVISRTPSSIDIQWASGGALGNEYIIARDIIAIGGNPSPANANVNLNDLIGSARIVGIVAHPTTTFTDNFTDTDGPAAPGTQYFYKIWNHTTSTSYSSGLTGSAFTLSAVPTAQVVLSAFSNLSATQIRANWTPATATGGTGTNRLVIVKKGSPVDAVPVDGTTYVANAVFGTGGSGIGPAGNFVVYNGTALNVTVTGLTNGDYHFKVYTFNGSGTTENYLTGIDGVIANKGTDPSAQPTSLAFTSLLNNGQGYTVGWTPVPVTTVDGYIVIREIGSLPSNVPADGNDTYVVGNEIVPASGEFVAFKGPASTFNEAALAAGTNYFYRIYSYNGSGTGINYLEATPLGGNRRTLTTEPAGQSTDITYGSPTNTTMTVDWTQAGAGAGNNMIVVGRAGSAPTPPTDGTTYSALLAFGTGGTTDGGSSFVVYKGSADAQITVTTLTPNTTYYFRAFEFNTTNATDENYNTAAGTNNDGTQSLATANEPTNQVTAPATPFANITATDMRVSWTAAAAGALAPTHYLVNAINKTPTAGTYLTVADGSLVNDDLDLTIATGNKNGAKIITFGTNLYNWTGLEAGQEYEFQIYSYRTPSVNASFDPDYKTATPATVSGFTEPAGQSTISFGTITSNTIAVNLSAVPTAAGVLVLRRSGSLPTVPSGIQDGTTYTVGATNIAGGTNTVVYNGPISNFVDNNAGNDLTPNTTYHYLAFTYSGSLTKINYLTTSPTNNNATTLVASATTTVTAAGGGEAATIPSTTTTSTGISVFNFTVVDDAGQTAKTRVTGITINRKDLVSGDIDDWSAVLDGARLSSTQGTPITVGVGPNITANSIIFSGIPTGAEELGELDNGETLTYTLRIWLKPSLGSAVIDGKNFVFQVTPPGSFTVGTGDAFAGGAAIESGDGNNVVAVVADRIRMTTGPLPTTVNATTPFTTQPVFEATDINNNRDTGFNFGVTSVNTGAPTNLGPAFAPVNFSSGVATFTNLSFSNVGTSTMTITSNAIVSAPPSALITVQASTTLSGGGLLGINPGPLVNNTTNQAVFGFTLATTGSTLNFTDVTISTTSDPDIAFKPLSVKLVRSTDNDFGTAGNNTIVSSTYTTPGNSIDFATFSESINGSPSYFFIAVDIQDFFPTSLPTIQLSLDNADFTVSTGNKTGGPVSGILYTLQDNTPPIVVSITPLVGNNGPNGISNPGALTYDVTFSEPVTGVSLGDFFTTSIPPVGLPNFPPVTGTPTGISGSGTSWVVTVTGVSETGQLRLDMNASALIVDTRPNSNVAGFTAGTPYNIILPEPTNERTTFSATAPGLNPNSSVNLSWQNPGGGIQKPTHVLIVGIRNGVGAFPSVMDGTLIAPSPNWNTTYGAHVVDYTGVYPSVSGGDNYLIDNLLLSGQQYTFRIYPYTLSPNNIPSNVDYKTDIFLTGNYTVPLASQGSIVVGSTTPLPTISSILAGSNNVFSFKIIDDGLAPSTDNAPILINTLVINRTFGGSNTIANWQHAIASAQLVDITQNSGSPIPGTVNATNISFPLNPAVGNTGYIGPDLTKEYELRITLQNPFVSTMDNLSFDFTVDPTNYPGSISYAPGSSLIAVGQLENRGPQTIQVLSTGLAFTTQPVPTAQLILTNFTTRPVIRAVDANGNVDTDFTGAVNNVTITTAASVRMNNPTSSAFDVTSFALTPSLGVIDFNILAPNFQYNDTNAGAVVGTLLASGGGLSSTVGAGSVACSVVNVTYSNASTIGSASGTPTISSIQSTAIPVFSFTVTDDGGAGGDGAATKIASMRFTPNGANEFGNFQDLMTSATLSSGAGTMTITSASGLNPTDLTFSAIPNSTGTLGNVGDSSPKIYTLSITLKTPLLGGALPATADNDKLVLNLIRNPDITFNTTGSTIPLAAPAVNSGTTNGVFQVFTTLLKFTTQPVAPAGSYLVSTVLSGQPPVPVVEAVDIYNNRDLNYTAAITTTCAVGVTPIALGTPPMDFSVGGGGIITAGTFGLMSVNAIATGAQLRVTASVTNGHPTIPVVPTSALSNAFDVKVGQASTIDNPIAIGAVPSTAHSAIAGTPVPSTGAAPVFSFRIREDAVGLNDGNPTLVTSITFRQNASALINSTELVDWRNAIGGAILSDGTTSRTVDFSITPAALTATSITISGIPIGVGQLGYITDSPTPGTNSKTYTLNIWLKPTLTAPLPITIDGKKFGFDVQTIADVLTDPNGTSLASGTAITPSGNTVNVVASRINYLTLPYTSVPSLAFPNSASVFVPFGGTIGAEAVDVNGNRDLGFGGTISAFSVANGLTFTNGPVVNTDAFASGTFTFNTNFQYTTGNMQDGTITMSTTTPTLNNQSSTAINIFSSTDSYVYVDPTFPAQTFNNFVNQQVASLPATANGTIATMTQLVLSDGGGATHNSFPASYPSGDADGAFTRISSIQFTVTGTGTNDIRTLALYDNATTPNKISTDQTITGGIVTFNGLNIQAADDLTTTFTLRGSFNSIVGADRDQVQFRVTGVTWSAGSQPFNYNAGAGPFFGGINGGTLSLTDIIDVVATSLDFTTQASPYAGINEPVGPSYAAPTLPTTTAAFVRARDKFTNIDTDFDIAAGSITITDLAGDNITSPAAFVNGDLNLDGLRYNIVGDGTLRVQAGTIATGPLDSSNPPGANVSAIPGALVNVVNVTATLPGSGIIPGSGSPLTASLKGGSQNQVIFGVTFTANGATGSEPNLTEFTFGFDIPYQTATQTIFTNFVIKEEVTDITSPAINGNFQLLSSAANSNLDIIKVDLSTIPRPLFSAPGQSITYYVIADVDATASISTPAITPIFIDAGYGDPTDVKIVTTAGTATGSFIGNVYTFASTKPPVLRTAKTSLTRPFSGQLNVDPAIDHILLEFDTKVGTLDGGLNGGAELYNRTTNVKVADLVAPLSAGNFLFTGDATSTITPLRYNIQFLASQSFQPDEVYYVLIKQGSFNPLALPVPSGTGISDQGLNFYGGISTNSTLYFKISSNLPPVLTQANATLHNNSVGSLSTKFDQFGTAYYMIVPSTNLSPPNAAQLKAPATYLQPKVANGSYSIDQINTKQTVAFPAITSFTSGVTYHVYIYAENDAMPTPVPAAGVYGSSLVANSGGPTAIVTLPVAPPVFQPSYLICPNSYVTISEPIILTEAATNSFSNGALLPGNLQDFNILLPPGYEFDRATNPTVQLIGADFNGIAPIVSFPSNTVLNIKYRNFGASPIKDNIVINNLRVIGLSGSTTQFIQRFFGNNTSFPSTTANIGTIGLTTTPIFTFDNSYSTNPFNSFPPGSPAIVNSIPDNYIDPTAPPGTIRLNPIISVPNDYNGSIFTGNGVAGDLLTLSAVTTNAAFNITMSHVDPNGCVSEKVQQYLVYDHVSPISKKLGTSNSLINPPGSAQGLIHAGFDSTSPSDASTSSPPIPSQTILNNELAGYLFVSLTADIPAEVKSGQVEQIISGPDWQVQVAKLPLPPTPVNVPPLGTYFNYQWDYAHILNSFTEQGGTILFDPYYGGRTNLLNIVRFDDNFNGNLYWKGGSLGNVEFTGLFRSTADLSVYVPFKQNVEIFVPAVPLIEVGSSNRSAFDNADATVNTQSGLTAFNYLNNTIGYQYPASYPGTSIFCEAGDKITLNGYPAALAGASTGSFAIYDFESYDFRGATSRTGTITTLTNSTSVVGIGTSFATELTVGDQLSDKISGNIIGIVQTITNNTNLVLTAPAALALTSEAYLANPNRTLVASAPSSAFVDNANGSMILDPAVIKNNYNDILVAYTYKQNNSPAVATGYLVMRVTPNPAAQFTIASVVGSPSSAFNAFCSTNAINFDAAPSTIALPTQAGSTNFVAQYLWDFGDPNSGLLNTAATAQAAHTYSFSSLFDVDLELTSNWGCASLPVIASTPVNQASVVLYAGSEGQIRVGDIPTVDFSFLGNCVGDNIQFTDNSSTPASSNSTPASYVWDFDFPNNVLASGNNSANVANTLPTTFANFGTSPDGTNVSHVYALPKNYDVSLTTTTNLGCSNSLKKTIVQLPLKVPIQSADFSEFFDTSDGGWQALDLTGTIPATGGNSSWVWNDPATPGKWATKSYKPNEKSALYSACLDLSSIPRPVLSYHSYLDLATGEGMVLQYSKDAKNIYDPTKGWDVLGTPANGNSPGLEWYNAFGLPSNPGTGYANSNNASGFGWANDQGYTVPKHKLEDTIDPLNPLANSRIILRFALSALGNATGKGITIDSLRVGSRTRTVLFENFTTTDGGSNASLNSDLSSEAQFITNFITQNIASTQVVNINYHIGFIGSDPFNLDNPADPSSRALFYNVTKAPYAFLDGIHSKENGSDLFQDWGAGAYDLQTLQLANADFKPAGSTITTVANNTDGSIEVDVVVKPTRDLPKTTTLHIAILEEAVLRSQLPNSASVTTNETQFNYVLKKLIPNAVGTKYPAGTFQRGVNVHLGPDGKVNTSDKFKWVPNKLYSNKLAVVLFLQDSTREVYQSEFFQNLSAPAPVTGLELLSSENVSVFPNPADEEVTIQLPAPAPQRVQLQMVDQVGRVVNEHFINEGERSKTISTRDLAGGIYLLQLGSGDTSTRMKILVVHGK